jgi:leucyl-tRNA synthetase
MVASGTSEAEHEAAARADARVAAALDGKTVRKVVIVPGRIVNFVIS